MSLNGSIVISAARRTPLGAFQGALSALSAPALAGVALRAALADSGIQGADVDEVLFGCVLPAGLGQAPARQAALAGGLPESVPTTTLNKVCGSGMKAVMLGADAIRAGAARVVVAGGFESMSNAPYLAAKARQGLRFGHAQLLDHLLLDGLQNASDGVVMGQFADATAREYGFTRQEQDEFAIESVTRALAAMTSGAFRREIATVEVAGRKGAQRIEEDEIPPGCKVDKIPALKPAFTPDGTVTAGSASSLADGAAALVLMDEHRARELGAAILARVIAQASFAQAPERFTTAPVGAIRRVLERSGWQMADVDLFEINEAFAVVTLATARDLSLDLRRVNIHGGACALGHPLGATGARILTTLVHAMRHQSARRGIAALCIGGGEATAIAVEMP